MTKLSESLEYWLVTLPNNGQEARTVNELSQYVRGRNGELSHLKQLPLKQLRVGKIDNLLSLSEEIVRIDAFGRNLVQKLHKTYVDLENSNEQLKVYNKSIAGFITGFQWDEGRLNPRLKLQDLVQSIHNTLQKTGEKLRSGNSKLSDYISQINAIERKKNASLMNKSLREYVDSKDWIDKTYIRSALIVVPKQKVNDFVESYEFLEDSDANKKLEKLNEQKWKQKKENLRKVREEQRKLKKQLLENENKNENNKKNENDINNNNKNNNNLLEEKDDLELELELDKPSSINILHSKGNAGCRTVVPNSLKKLAEDNECVVFQVHLLRQGYDWFKAVCREKGCNVRDFTFDNNNDKDEEKQLNSLIKNRDDQSKKLRIYCRSTFSEVFSRFIHLKIIRTFAESVLRYGLPIDFSISVIKPPQGYEKRLLKTLELKYSHLLDDSLKNPTKENDTDFSGLAGEFYPFVYTPIKLEL